MRAWAEPLVEIHQMTVQLRSATAAWARRTRAACENWYPDGTRPVRQRQALRPTRPTSSATRSRPCLRLEADYGVNPFKFGFIACAADDHQSLGGATDDGRLQHRAGQVRNGRRGLEVIGRPAAGGATGPVGREHRQSGRLVMRVGRGEHARGDLRRAATAAMTFGNSGTRIHVASSPAVTCPPTSTRGATWSRRRTWASCRWAPTCRRRPAGNTLDDAPARCLGDEGLLGSSEPAEDRRSSKGWAASDGETTEQEMHGPLCG